MKKTTLPLSKSPSQNGLNGKNRPKIKLFVSHSMSACNEDSVLLFCELAKKAGFEPVLATGASPRPPMEKIQAMLAECRSFAALIQPPNYGEACSMWLPAEIGMAIGKGLPTIALCETHLMPAAKSLLAANLSLLDIGQGQLFGQKAKISQLLLQLRNQIVQGPPHFEPKTPEIEVLPTRFDERIQREWHTKQAVANYTLEHFLRPKDRATDEEVFVDSGTTTFQLLQQLALAPDLMVRIRTNNVPGLNELCQIPSYPVFSLPGRGRSKYNALLGSETIGYLETLLVKPADQFTISLGIIAATSITADGGICGNDNDHNDIKRLILNNCPHCVVIFDGTKLLHSSGQSIFFGNKGWQSFIQSHKQAGRRVDFVTHEPENLSKMSLRDQSTFARTLAMLEQNFGRTRVVVLK